MKPVINSLSINIRRYRVGNTRWRSAVVRLSRGDFSLLLSWKELSQYSGYKASLACVLSGNWLNAVSIAVVARSHFTMAARKSLSVPPACSLHRAAASMRARRLMALAAHTASSRRATLPPLARLSLVSRVHQ